MATNSVSAKASLDKMSGQFSTFFVDDLFFGVDVLDVQEVLRSQLMTPVPQAPEIVQGLINLRGQIVTAIDMRRRLLLPPLAGEHPPMNMVVRTADGAVSLLVDEIGDVLDMDDSTYEKPPENLDPAARELIRGVYKLSDRLLLVLDTEKAVEAGSFSSPRSTSHDGSVDAASLRRRSASQSFEAAAVEAAEPTGVKTPAKKATRKPPVRKANGTGR